MKTRDTHHHGNLKAALIEWALAQARAGRLEQASLREAAREIGVSPGAVYRHFDDREALLRTLTARGFDELARHFEAAMPLDKRPEDAAQARSRFVALGTAYLAFAEENYGLWRLMFGPSAMVMAAPPHRPAAFLWLRQAIVDLAATGEISQSGPEAELFAWSAIHGLCELLASPALGLPRPQDAAAFTCARVIAALR